MKQERRIANTIAIYSLWINWMISGGALVSVLIASLYIPKLLLPLLVFALELMLYCYVRYNSVSKNPTCIRLPHVVMIILFWSALIMVLINILHEQTFIKIPWLINNVNKDIPYIGLLILAPVAFIVTLYNIRGGKNKSICFDCQIRYGTVSERGFLGRLYSQEGDYLSQMLLTLSLFLSVIGWCYYFVFYINTNINAIDEFVFVWAPTCIYILSLVYLGLRYFSLWIYYCQNIEGQSLRYNSSSLVRYIVMCGDYIYLKEPNVSTDDVVADDNKIDTPARLFIKYKKTISEYNAMDYFASLSGIRGAELRFLYENTNFNTECNIFHYAYIVESREIIDNSQLEGKWFTLPEIKAMINQQKISGIFVSEIDRIYTIVMSWKTYDKHGNRLYDIKHYKPTFRLRDFKDWDVDFNDKNWLFIATNNSDRPFFRLRNLWNKYISGIGV